jgi:hypothetical protein
VAAFFAASTIRSLLVETVYYFIAQGVAGGSESEIKLVDSPDCHSGL